MAGSRHYYCMLCSIKCCREVCQNHNYTHTTTKSKMLGYSLHLSENTLPTLHNYPLGHWACHSWSFSFAFLLNNAADLPAHSMDNFPALPRYPLLLGGQRHMWRSISEDCRSLQIFSPWSRIEPQTLWSKVRCPTNWATNLLLWGLYAPYLV